MKLCFIVNHWVKSRKEVFKGTATPWGYSGSFQHYTVVKTPSQLLPVGWRFRKDEHPVFGKQQDPATSSPWHVTNFQEGTENTCQDCLCPEAPSLAAANFCHQESQIVTNPFALVVWKKKLHTIEKRSWFHGKRKRLPRKHREATKRNKAQSVSIFIWGPLWLMSSMKRSICLMNDP